MRELRRRRLFGDRSIDWKSEINWPSTVSPNACINDRPLNAAKMQARFVVRGHKRKIYSLWNKNAFTCNLQTKKWIVRKNEKTAQTWKKGSFSQICSRTPRSHPNLLRREISLLRIFFSAVPLTLHERLVVVGGYLHFKRESILPLLFAKSAKVNARLKPTHTRRRRHNKQRRVISLFFSKGEHIPREFESKAEINLTHRGYFSRWFFPKRRAWYFLENGDECIDALVDDREKEQ